MRIEVEVTQADIDDAGDDGYSCPVALAVRRALVLEDSRDIYAGLNYLEVYAASPVGFRVGEYWWPRAVEVFIDRYDNGKAVEPFRFTIDDVQGG